MSDIKCLQNKGLFDPTKYLSPQQLQKEDESAIIGFETNLWSIFFSLSENKAISFQKAPFGGMSHEIPSTDWAIIVNKLQELGCNKIIIKSPPPLCPHSSLTHMRRSMPGFTSAWSLRLV